MEGLIVMGLCFMFLAFVWVIYLAPKAARARQDEFIRRLRDRESTRDDEPMEEGEDEAEEEK